MRQGNSVCLAVPETSRKKATFRKKGKRAANVLGISQSEREDFASSSFAGHTCPLAVVLALDLQSPSRHTGLRLWRCFQCPYLPELSSCATGRLRSAQEREHHHNSHKKLHYKWRQWTATTRGSTQHIPNIKHQDDLSTCAASIRNGAKVALQNTDTNLSTQLHIS